jgi:hypothetical protein
MFFPSCSEPLGAAYMVTFAVVAAGADFVRPTSAAPLRMTLSTMLWASSFVRYFAVSSAVFGLWNVICIVLFRFKGDPSLIY